MKMCTNKKFTNKNNSEKILFSVCAPTHVGVSTRGSEMQCSAALAVSSGHICSLPYLLQHLVCVCEMRLSSHAVVG